MREYADHVADLVQSSADAPWFWLLIFAVAGLDALLPFMPSETTVLTVAVLIGPVPGRLALLGLVAAGGALAGDLLGHTIGRRAGPRAVARLLPGERGRKRYERARASVHRHAPTLLIAARYLPGGRVAAALATGSLGFPQRRFAALDAVGCALWAVLTTLTGALGGAAFAHDPLRGLICAFGLTLAILALVGAARRLGLGRRGFGRRLGRRGSGRGFGRRGPPRGWEASS
jgi:membrane protein DedA with SNARE-associated domain